MNFIGQLLPLLVLGTMVWLIVARRTGASLPRFRMPAPPPPRPKRTTKLKLVKGAAMDRQLADLLRSEDAHPRD
ncbi:MAG TPA: hypothetical protein VGP41_04620 [Candidatus Lustribacter sp.]|jgi:hypothetical protein|nr:hypothetical protein [Candidatus Lustribacter sp.]